VNGAATEIASGSQELASSSSQQASALDQVTSRIKLVEERTKRSAQYATEAKGIVASARESTQKGAASMGELATAVEGIKSAADKTARIVKTIDEIAFQTNLLALNAAVEAARAGDAGKGFAVVAEEVRNLAMRSAEAAKNTASLIEESVKSSDLGVRLNAEVSAHFDGISGKVRQVVEVMGEIAAASEHQSRGVAQINSAVDEMSRVTQHNAATTEQSAAAAEELSAQSSSVQERIRSFQLGEGGGWRATVTPLRPSVKPRAAAPAQKRGKWAPSPVRATGTTHAAPSTMYPTGDDMGLSDF
jgi:methyl-accepting chemotaxis protein